MGTDQHQAGGPSSNGVRIMAAQRDSAGKFLPGNTLAKGRGRPPKKREEEYYNATVGGVSLSAWKKIVQRAVIDAQRGNAAARSWLTNILMAGEIQDTSGQGVPDVIEVAIKKIYGGDEEQSGG